MDLARGMERQRPTATLARLAVNDLLAETLQDEIEVGRRVLMGRNDDLGAVEGLHQGDSRNLTAEARATEEGAGSEFRDHGVPLPDRAPQSRPFDYSIRIHDSCKGSLLGTGQDADEGSCWATRIKERSHHLARAQDALPAAGQTLPGGLAVPRGASERFRRCFLHRFPPFPGLPWRKRASVRHPNGTSLSDWRSAVGTVPRGEDLLRPAL